MKPYFSPSLIVLSQVLKITDSSKKILQRIFVVKISQASALAPELPDFIILPPDMVEFEKIMLTELCNLVTLPCFRNRPLI